MSTKPTHEELEKKVKELENIKNNNIGNYIQLLETISDGVIVLDYDFRCIMVNDAACKFMQLPKEKILYNKPADVFPGINKESFYKNYEQVMKTRMPVAFTAEYIYPDGRQGWYEEHVNPIPEGILVIITDITDRKLIEEKLKKSQEKYKNLFNNAQVGLYRSRISDGKLLECNDLFAKLSGYKDREECIRKCNVIDHYSDIKQREEMLRRLKKEGYIERFEVTAIDNNGLQNDLAFSARIYPEIDCLEGAIINITPEKKAEAESKERGKLLSMAFEASGLLQGITTIKDGKHIQVNQQTLNVLGYKKKEIIGKTTKEINFLKDYKQRKIIRETLLTNGYMRDYEIKFYTKSGELRYGICNGDVVKIDGIKYFMTATNDITDRKKVENKLIKKESELKKKAKELEELNSALKVLLNKRDEDKLEFEDSILTNVKTLIDPYLDKLKNGRLPNSQKIFLKILEDNLIEITSSFSRRLSSKLFNLSPSEIQVANLVKKGKTNKECSEILSVTIRTVSFHRGNIRRKLGIKNRKINLKTYLLSLN
ncbi:MAG: PAS domain S-box protein [Desulfobacterales bacterium]|jgi:PAS domain S-box-containing protein|nr:PAS domain S-box protein [Desulfobacterales bacterium]